MATVQVLHCKEKNQGCRFDGTCYATSSFSWGDFRQDIYKSTGSLSNFSVLKFMIKFNSFTGADDTVKYFYDAGDTADEHLKIGIRLNSSKFYPHVVLFGETHTLTTEIEPEKIYQLTIYYVSGTGLLIAVADKYNKSSVVELIDSTPTITNETYIDSLTIGAESGGTNGLSFILYAMEIVHLDTVYSADETVRWLFRGYKNTTYPSSIVFDIESGTFATTIASTMPVRISVTSIPDDFWIDEQYDLSDYVSNRITPLVNDESNKLKTQIFTSSKLEIFNYPNTITTDDTILIKINSITRFVLRIDQITVESLSGNEQLYQKLHLEHFLMEAKNMRPRTFFSGYWDKNGSSISTFPSLNDRNDDPRLVWWAGIDGTNDVDYSFGDADFTSNWISFKHMLERIIDFFQYGNLLSLDYSNMTGEASLYYSSEHSTYIDYDDLLFMTTMAQRIGYGTGSAKESLPKALSQIFSMTFVKYNINGSNFIAYPHDYESDYSIDTDISDNNYTSLKSLPNSYSDNFFVTGNICKNASYMTPDLTGYSNWPTITGTIEEVYSGGGETSLEAKTNKVTFDLLSHLWLAYKNGTTEKFMYYNLSTTSTFIYQFAQLLNERLVRDVIDYYGSSPIDVSFNEKFYLFAKDKKWNLKNKQIEFKYEE